MDGHALIESSSLGATCTAVNSSSFCCAGAPQEASGVESVIPIRVSSADNGCDGPRALLLNPKTQKPELDGGLENRRPPNIPLL